MDKTKELINDIAKALNRDPGEVVVYGKQIQADSQEELYEKITGRKSKGLTKKQEAQK